MNDTELDAFILSGAALLGIPLDPQWRPAIRMHLAISLGHAATVLEFELPDEADPAPVFQP